MTTDARSNGEQASLADVVVVSYNSRAQLRACIEPLLDTSEANVIVVDNASYGTIRMHQERRYPHRISGTDLVNPDFAALARAYGAWGATVERTEDFAAAVATAIAQPGVALLHLKVDVEQIGPAVTVTQLRGG